MRLGIARWGLLAAVAGSLAGCLGGGGDGGSTAPTTSTPTTTTPTVASQPPTLGPGNSTYNVASLSPDQWAALQLDTTNSKVTGASVSSPPKVYFNVVDAAGNPVAGLKAGTGGNLSFAIAKLVPGTNGAPSKWVSYIVMNNVNNTPGKPSVENYGTLKDNGNGSYEYTFYRDITTAKADLAATTALPSACGTAATASLCNKADLDDLTYDANLTHRIGIQINGTTSTSTKPLADPINLIYDFVPATGAAVAATETDGNKQRNIVDMRNCQTCHVKFYVHGGGANQLAGIGGPRQDPRFCVLCHTDQRKYSVAESTVTATTVSPPALPANGTSTDRIGNMSNHFWPSWVHKIHMGEYLVKTGYFHSGGGGFSPEHVAFPQDPRNCTKCHSDNDGATGGNTVPQADNWKNKPSRQACGGCHDGIDFATGTGYTAEQRRLAAASIPSTDYPVTRDKVKAKLAALTPTGHIGGAQSSDQNCVLCHTSDVVAAQHIPVNVGASTSTQFAASPANLPTGAKKITYDLNSVSVNSSRQPVFKFKFKDETGSTATDVVFNTPSSTAQLMSNFTGSTSVYLTFSVPQDGLVDSSGNSKSADWNAYVSADILGIFRGTATGASAGTLSATPDSSGYYTLTMTGVSIPTNATNMTGWLGLAGGLTQTNVAGYAALNVVADAVSKVATGSTARRAIVDKSRCNSCHNKLGTFYTSNFHGSQRNDPQACAMCHRPNQSSGGWSSASIAYIHGIHAGSKRTVDFTWHTSNLGTKTGDASAFADLGYPGTLRECRQCHLPNTVNFGTSTTQNNSNAKYAYEQGNVPYYTVGQNKYLTEQTYNGWTYSSSTGTCGASSTTSTVSAAAAAVTSPYVAKGTFATTTDYGAGFAYNFSTTAGSASCNNSGIVLPALAAGATREAADTTLVNSPIANACSSCHTTDPAMAHMRANGAYLYASRASIKAANGGKMAYTEQCIVCHGAGKVADAEVVHRSSAGLTAAERN